MITADACTLVFAALYLICTAILAMCREQAWTEAKAGADAGMGMLDYLNLLTIPAYSPLERVLDWLCAFVRPLYLLCVEWRWSQKARRGFSSTKLMKNTSQENH